MCKIQQLTPCGCCPSQKTMHRPRQASVLVVVAFKVRQGPWPQTWWCPITIICQLALYPKSWHWGNTYRKSGHKKGWWIIWFMLEDSVFLRQFSTEEQGNWRLLSLSLSLFFLECLGPIQMFPSWVSWLEKPLARGQNSWDKGMSEACLPGLLRRTRSFGGMPWTPKAPMQGNTCHT